MAKKEKEAYQEAVRKYEDEHGPIEVKKRGKAAATGGKRKAASNLPKKPLTSFMRFCKDKRAELKAKNPDAPFGEIGKLLGEAWKNVEPSLKSKYEKAYQADMDAWRKMVDEGDYEKPVKGGKSKKKKAEVSDEEEDVEEESEEEASEEEEEEDDDE